MNESKKIELLEQEIKRLTKVIDNKDSLIEQLQSNSFKSLEEIEKQKFELLDDTTKKYNLKLLELEEQLDKYTTLEKEYFELVSKLKKLYKETIPQK